MYPQPPTASDDPDASTGVLPGYSSDGPGDGDGDGGGPPDDGGGPGRRRWSRRRKVLVGVLAATVLVGSAGAALVFERQSAYDRNIERIPQVFPTSQSRPPRAPGEAQNWLIVGSDRRADEQTTGEDAAGESFVPGAQRTDTIILMHVPADRKHAYAVSFPRDSFVPIPGHGTTKLNAAFSYGGPALLIDTFERLTRIRVDHFAVIDFAGFTAMTDALGGVDVTVPQTVYDPKNRVTWTAGRQHLDGERALLFVRQRYNLPGGDLDRIKRQHMFLRAVADKAVSGGTLSNPLKLNAFLEALTSAVSVDDSVRFADLRSLAVSMRSIRPRNVEFLTTPTSGTGMEGPQSVVYLDRDRGRRLWDALRADRMAAYLETRG